MKGLVNLFFMLWGICLLFGCDYNAAPKRLPQEINRSFYFWRNTYEISSTERQVLDSLGINRIYLRLFDVDWNHQTRQPVTLEGVFFKEPPNSTREIVPVVYITQRTVQLMEPRQVPRLAEDLHSWMGGLKKRFPQLRIKEWQLDCDWTENSKDNYFQLLQMLKDTLATQGIALSSTIRLHQIKYRQRTGVPPVDRGVLMYYNLGRLTDTTETNSIYNDATAAKYMAGFDTYPLPLDVALPIFSWGVWFRSNNVQGLIHGLRNEDLVKDFQKQGSYMVATADQFVNGFQILKGDKIRLEAMDGATAMQAVARIAPQIKTLPLNVILYHLDVNALKGFTPYELEQVYRAFE